MPQLYDYAQSLYLLHKQAKELQNSRKLADQRIYRETLQSIIADSEAAMTLTDSLELQAKLQHDIDEAKGALTVIAKKTERRA